ncbi:alcohol dehydrogenase catalytic domain-containing protein (plasmid) [Arthrobacter sp. UC242_113]|uniref:alcohol dehydrogenase catalytic domain-containing protein n=1 Tax=Arthrobacter sp. UC242_113 TaxID=3374550 RepID=UPI003756C720
MSDRKDKNSLTGALARHYENLGQQTSHTNGIENISKSVEFDAPGDPEVLRIVESTLPHPDATEVVIEVATVGMNFADLLQRRGVYGLKPEATERLGLECAGRVVSVGADVTSFQEGDEVCALLPGGAYVQSRCPSTPP